MSSDKNKLHDRSMKLLNKISDNETKYGGMNYCSEYGIGPSKELTYLLKNNFVKFIKENWPSKSITKIVINK